MDIAVGSDSKKLLSNYESVTIVVSKNALLLIESINLGYEHIRARIYRKYLDRIILQKLFDCFYFEFALIVFCK